MLQVQGSGVSSHCHGNGQEKGSCQQSMSIPKITRFVLLAVMFAVSIIHLKIMSSDASFTRLVFTLEKLCLSSAMAPTALSPAASMGL